MELNKVYNPKEVEEKWYSFWEKKGFFHGRTDSPKESFSLAIPPPNITGILTMGHVLDNVPQDIMARWKRMEGYETVWVPGTDHAGIATQNVVEKDLAKEGLTRWDLGREEFVQRVWKWKEEYGQVIIGQLKRLGCSCDWKRLRFTLDEGLTQAVQEAFLRLYEKGLIYKGNYIINWCPRCSTALSDEEARHKEIKGKLWYIRYPLKGSNGFVTVATTRPETMLGDVALAINPEDKRHKGLLKLTPVLPILGRELRVIEDDFVDPKFGTGVVKVTPAHDVNDFEMAKRHNLTPILVMDKNGRMNQEAGPYKGLDRFACRRRLLEDLKEQGLLEKEEDHLISVGHCQRCDTMVEPYLSEQWFVRMKPLAQPAIEAVEKGEIRFFPPRWKKVYLNWLYNIRDWCISRQLWWGHRIPIWYCQGCGQSIPGRVRPQLCPHCQGKDLSQEEDVLDTWFSSWLWPFSVFGWPQNTPDLQRFYPLSFQNSGYDIIFFWVARMIMAGYEFTGRAPFSQVYIHGMVLDELGRWMSKSLGNSPDPSEIIGEFGADAVRFSIILITAQGQDAYFSKEKVHVGRNFANKLWNASRFILAQTKDFTEDASHLDEEKLDLADRWILSRFHRTIKLMTASLEGYRFNEAAHLIYDFTWHDFCDWYIELSKIPLYQKEKEGRKSQVQALLLYCLEGLLRLLHPFMPFITEEIWQKLRPKSHRLWPGEEESITIAPWPIPERRWRDRAVEREMAKLQGIVVAVRNMRAELGIPPGKKTSLILKPTAESTLRSIEENSSYITHLARVEELILNPAAERPSVCKTAVVEDVEVFLPLEGLIDLQEEKEKLKDQIDRIQSLVEKANQKLMNRDFLKKAPQEVIERERAKVEEGRAKLEKLKENLKSLSGG